MATDPSDIKLSDAQRQLLAEIANSTGKSWADLLDEVFSRLPRHDTNGKTERLSLFDALNSRGLIGAYDGPGDLSTNTERMEGFGEPHYPEFK